MSSQSRRVRRSSLSPSDEIEGRYPQRVIRARGIRPLDTGGEESAILFATGCVHARVHANSGRRIAAGRASEKRETRVPRGSKTIGAKRAVGTRALLNRTQ